MLNNIIVGTVAGTGSAINVSIGFQPRAVQLFNTGGDSALNWTTDMGAGYGQKIVTSGAGVTDVSTITSGGITVYTGSSSASEGFTIGTDLDLNASGQDIRYIAYR